MSGPAGFGEWLARQMAACGFATNVDLEEATGIGNTTISRWRNGVMAPTVDQLRKLEKPLRTPLLELMVRAGVISADEARIRPDVMASAPQVVVDVAEAIRHDTDLLEEARQHLLNQYELLLRISPAASSAGAGRKRQRRPQPPAAALPVDPRDRVETEQRRDELRREHNKRAARTRGRGKESGDRDRQAGKSGG